MRPDGRRREMRSRRQEILDLLFKFPIIGFEEKKEEEDEGEEQEEEGEEEGEEEDDEGEDDDGEKPDVGKLKSALASERKERKTAQKELKRLQRLADAKKKGDETDLEQEREERKKNEDKVAKLATKLRTSAENEVVTKMATKLKFRDLDDAITLVDRSQFDVEQDEDEPADVEVDEDTVLTALKALAKKKPHLLLPDGEEGGASGGSLGRRNKRGDDQGADEEVLADKYSALRGRSVPAR